MKVSIVIRSYNEEEHIGRLLSGITRQTIKDLEIIIVDSGSTDATLSIASRYPERILTGRLIEYDAIPTGVQIVKHY
jgi:rhamnosyltransferase